MFHLLPNNGREWNFGSDKVDFEFEAQVRGISGPTTLHVGPHGLDRREISISEGPTLLTSPWTREVKSLRWAEPWFFSLFSGATFGFWTIQTWPDPTRPWTWTFCHKSLLWLNRSRAESTSSMAGRSVDDDLWLKHDIRFQRVRFPASPLWISRHNSTLGRTAYLEWSTWHSDVTSNISAW